MQLHNIAAETHQPHPPHPCRTHPSAILTMGRSPTADVCSIVSATTPSHISSDTTPDTTLSPSPPSPPHNHQPTLCPPPPSSSSSSFLPPSLSPHPTDRSHVAAAAAPKALTTGPVVLADADSRDLLSTQLRSGKDLIQTPFGQLPTISEKVCQAGRRMAATPAAAPVTAAAPAPGGRAVPPSAASGLLG